MDTTDETAGGQGHPAFGAEGPMLVGWDKIIIGTQGGSDPVRTFNGEGENTGESTLGVAHLHVHLAGGPQDGGMVCIQIPWVMLKAILMAPDDTFGLREMPQKTPDGATCISMSCLSRPAGKA